MVLITPTRKKLFGNFFSLSLLEILNYIMPLITLPYLVRILGPAKFGVVAFAQAMMQILVIFTDYGYYLSAPRKIAVNRNDQNEVSMIFSRIMCVKMAFLVLSLGIMLGIVFSFSKFHEHLLLYLLSFGYVLSDYLLPMWFFQGMEKMKYITILYFIAKSIYVAAVFIFIKTPHDYFLVPAFNSLGMILSGIAGLFIIKILFRVEFRLPRGSSIINEIKDGWYYFISTLSISINAYAGIFILGLLTNDLIVGYYSAAERLIRAIQRILWAVSQSIYPHVNKLAAESKEMALVFIRKSFYFIGGSFLLISLAILICARYIIHIVLGAQYGSSVQVLTVLSFLPFLLTISNIFGIQTMISFDMKKAYARIMVLTAAVNILLSLGLSYFFRHTGLAFAVLGTEVSSILMMGSYLKKRGVSIYRREPIRWE